MLVPFRHRYIQHRASRPLQHCQRTLLSRNPGTSLLNHSITLFRCATHAVELHQLRARAQPAAPHLPGLLVLDAETASSVSSAMGKVSDSEQMSGHACTPPHTGRQYPPLTY
jgi:hypothetical protein